MRNMRLALLIITALLIIGSVAAAGYLQAKHNSEQATITDNQPVTYTDAITGLSSEIKPGENGSETTTPQINPPVAFVAGMEQLRNYLTDAQYSSVQGTMSDFLLTHSGLSDV